MLGLMIGGLASPGWSAPERDEPMRIWQQEEPRFPLRLLDLGVKSGDVRVSVLIDAEGKMADYLVTGYSEPEFRDSVLRALAKWEFAPARVDGEPRNTTADLLFEFEQEGIVVVSMDISSFTERMNARLAGDSRRFRTRTLRELDRIPVPTTVVQPVFPVNPATLAEPVSVTVFFFIDQEGRVRLPAVKRSTDEKHTPFAISAVQAVSQWRFEPPLAQGVPSIVAARQEITFRREDKSDAPKSSAGQ